MIRTVCPIACSYLASHCEPGASFHARQRLLGALKKHKQSVTAEFNTLDDIARGICPDHVKDVLAQVDSIDGRASRCIANHVSSSSDRRLRLRREDGADYPITGERAGPSAASCVWP